MSEFEAAAMVEAMSVDDDGFEARFAGAACISDAVAAGANDMEGVDAANEENINVQQPSRHPQDSGIDPMLVTTRSTSSDAANGNHSHSEVASEPDESSPESKFTLTEDVVRQRALELFPDGASEPAVLPRQPPVMNEATNELCTLCLHVSQYVKLVKGKLDRYEVTGYLVADFLGIELLPPPDSKEALKVGTSARGHAQRAGKEAEQKKKNAAAKKSKLRQKHDDGKLDL